MKLRFYVVDKTIKDPNRNVIASFRYIDDAYDYQSRQYDSENLAVYDELSGTPEQWKEDESCGGG